MEAGFDSFEELLAGCSVEVSSVDLKDEGVVDLEEDCDFSLSKSSASDCPEAVGIVEGDSGFGGEDGDG